MSTSNPNYHQVNGGWQRKPSAPNVTTPSHIKWERVKSIESIRKGIADGRARQNAVNEAHKQKHGGG